MVRIEMDSSLEGVAVTIADNGPGVPAEIKERIFDPFFTTRDVGEGAGLGLTVARGIAVEHGGALDLLPVRAPGAIFRLILPYGAAVRKP
jgi:C4-dicarboxylate-specific signal transduction histidine kinase